jgi:hypothetical protein
MTRLVLLRCNPDRRSEWNTSALFRDCIEDSFEVRRDPFIRVGVTDTRIHRMYVPPFEMRMFFTRAAARFR